MFATMSLHRALTGLCAAAALLSPFSAEVMPAFGSEYFVSSTEGDDAGDGRSGKTPFRTMARLQKEEFSPGDTIRLRCGDVWDETFIPRGDGTADRPIVLASYGEGPRPLLRRDGSAGSMCLKLSGLSGWTVSGLEFSRAVYAIFLDYSDARDKKGIRIEDCYFHEILPAEGEKVQAGTIFCNWGVCVALANIDEKMTPGLRLDGLTISRCVVRDCGALLLSNRAAPPPEKRKLVGPVAVGGEVRVDRCTVQRCFANVVSFFRSEERECSLRKSVFVHNGGQRDFPWGGTDVIVSFCGGGGVIEDCEFGWRRAFGKNPDGCAIDFEWPPTSDWTVRRCDIHDCDSNAVLFMKRRPFTNIRIENCLIRLNNSRNYVGAIRPDAGATGSIVGNTYYLLPGRQFIEKKGAIGIEVSGNKPGALETLPTPAADREAGTFDGPQTISLSCADPGAVIRYTTDGSLPTMEDARYEGPISISRTCALNAKAFKDGMEASYSMSHIYEIGRRNAAR